MADLILPISIRDELIDLARQAAPRECCGIIATHNKVAAKIYPATNIAERNDRYEISGAEQYDLGMQIAYDWPDALMVFYHSHVATDPVPSPPDIIIARQCPDDLHMIVGPVVGRPSEVRVYWIDHSGVREADVQTADAKPPEQPSYAT